MCYYSSTQENPRLARPGLSTSSALTHVSDPNPENATQERGSEETSRPDGEPEDAPSSLGSPGGSEGTVITSIRATDLALGLKRIPTGFYAMAKHSGPEWGTESKHAPVNSDIEWSGPIPIPSDRSATVYLAVPASFEFQPTLCDDEQLRELIISVGELLDESAKELWFTLFPKDADVISPCSILLVTLRRQEESSGSSTSMALDPHCSSIHFRDHLDGATDSGHSALSRFRKHREKRDFEHAVEQFEHALNTCPLDHPCRAVAQSSTAMPKQIHYRVYDTDVSLDISLTLSPNTRTVRLVSHPDRPSTLVQLAAVHLARFDKWRDEADPTQAETFLLGAMDLSSADGHGNQATNFVPQLHAGRPAGIVQAGSQSSVGPDPASGPTDMNPLDSSPQLPRHSKRFADLAGLELAIATLDASLRSIPIGDQLYLVKLTNLGVLLRCRFHLLGKLSDLEEAISRQRDAVDLTPDSHSDKPMQLNNLSNSFFTRFKHLGNLSDLQEAISRQQDAVYLIPDDHPDKPRHLNSLGTTFLTRFQRLGNLSDLKEAISRQWDAVDLTPDDHPDKYVWLDSLGSSFLTRFLRLGNLSDLEEAISRQQDAVNLTPDGHPDKPGPLNNLGSSLHTRFQRLGNLSDLEEAILRRRDAVNLTPDGHPDKPKHLDSLGITFFTRFERLGDLSDLEEAILRQLDAVDLAPGGHPEKPMWLSNLGISFGTRFERLGNLTDLEEAMSRQRDAVDLTPDGHPDKPRHLSNLGNSFFIRFERLGNLSDLEEAISRQRDAVDLGPDGHPCKPMWLNNLGSFFGTRFQRLGNLNDLQEAISRLWDAVDLTPDGHPDKPILLSNLGYSFTVRFQHLKVPNDLEHAILLFSHAACATAGPTAVRFHASRRWISCARRLRHHSLLQAYSVAVGLLPQLAWIGLSLAHRFRELVQGADVVCEAAAAALESGHPETAVEWLEQGRSIIWGGLFQLRSPHDELSSAYPDHARRLRELSAALEHASATREKSSSPGSGHRGTESLQREADNHRTLAIERDQLLEDIRKMPGFERFLLQKKFSQLRAAAHSGPVVILNAAEARCDALIVLTDVDHVIHVPLPNFTLGRSKEFKTRLNGLARQARVSPHDERDGQPVPQEHAVEWKSMLASLWKCVVKPVLDALAFSTPGELSRIFWCPTGPLTFLPIHAAGIHYVRSLELGSKVFDFVVSSYVPTLSILASSSSSKSESESASLGGLRLLTVRQLPSDGQPKLPGVDAELEHIRAVIKNSPSARTTLTESSVGTVEEVLALMKEADWVHFACHGVQDDANPTESGLCLADRRHLRVSDITALTRPHGGLAFLSACQTARGDETLSDEAIHIAAGMLFAGYGGVVGTMWSISDKLAPDVAKDVYERLFRNGRTPDYREAARALHDAVQRLRDGGTRFGDWLPFIHVGL